MRRKSCYKQALPKYLPALDVAILAEGCLGALGARSLALGHFAESIFHELLHAQHPLQQREVSGTDVNQWDTIRLLIARLVHTSSGAEGSTPSSPSWASLCQGQAAGQHH